jgi:hypothetical protein
MDRNPYGINGPTADSLVNGALLEPGGQAVELDITKLDDQGTLFFPFTTTMIEILLNREPVPFDQESQLLKFLKN